jgi:hypothetical protein
VVFLGQRDQALSKVALATRRADARAIEITHQCP